MNEIVIKRKGIVVMLNRDNLVEVQTTHDGVVFNFKHGLYLAYIDTYMPLQTKQMIKNATDSYNAKKLVVDLDNYKTPVYIDAT